MAVQTDKLLNEAAKQITNSLFKEIDKQKIDPKFLQNFADQLLKRVYISQSKNSITEAKSIKEFTSLVGQIKKIYNNIFKELTSLKQSIKAKDSTASPERKSELETYNNIETNETVIERGNINTPEEQREGRPQIIASTDKPQNVIVQDFSDNSLEKLKNFFSNAQGLGLNKKLSSMGSLDGVGTDEGMKPLDYFLIGKTLLGSAAGGAGLAVLLSKLKKLFSKTPPTAAASGAAKATTTAAKAATTAAKPVAEAASGAAKTGSALTKAGSAIGKFIKPMSAIARKLPLLEAGFNVFGSAGDLYDEKELGIGQKIATGGISLLGAAPDLLPYFFDPTAYIGTASKVFGFESPVGEGITFELMNMLGLKDEDKSFGESLRERSKTMFKQYNKYMEDLEEKAQITRERGNVGLEDVLGGQMKAQKQGYVIRDITQKVTPKQFAMYYHGKISNEEFQKLAGEPFNNKLRQNKGESVELQKNVIEPESKMLETQGKAQPLITSLPSQESISSKTQEPQLNFADVDFDAMGIDISKEENLSKLVDMQLNKIRNSLDETDSEKFEHSFYKGIDQLNETMRFNFEKLTTPPTTSGPGINDFLDPQKLTLNNNTLEKIAINTSETHNSLNSLNNAILKLATVFSEKMPSGGTTIVNTGNTATNEAMPAAVVANNNFDLIREVRRQFA